MTKTCYECIREMSSEYPVRQLYEMMKVSHSGYYKWLNRRGALNRWQIEDQHIVNLIRGIHSVKPSFGYRRIAIRIRKDTNKRISGKSILRCMQKLKIQSHVRRKCKFGVGEEHVSLPNLLNRNFKATRPMEKIATDITYLYSRGKASI